VPRWWREGQFAEVDAEQAEAEKGEGVACFFQATKGIFFRLGEMLEEAGDLGETKLARVAFAVEEDEVTGAVGEALARLGPAEVGEGGLAELVEQARRLGRDVRGGRIRRRLGHGRASCNGDCRSTISVQANKIGGEAKTGKSAEEP